MNYYQTKESILQKLLLAFAFIFPLTVAGGNFIASLIIILWVIDKNIFKKIENLYKNSLVRAFFLFFIVHLIGLFWTDNLSWGGEISRKMLEFAILFPILIYIVKLSNKHLLVNIFLAAISVSVFTSILIWLDLIEPFKNATLSNPTPFASHITHTPFVAFGAFIIGSHILNFYKTYNNLKNLFLLLLFLTFSLNIFITGGRAGQIVYIVLMGFLFFSKMKLSIRSVIIFSLILMTTLFLVFKTSPIFKARIHSAINDIQTLSSNKTSSVGARITYAQNTLRVFLKNPIFGVGTGDFPKEYSKVKKEFSPGSLDTRNPHNMYLLILAQLGVLGLYFFIVIFYRLYRSLPEDNPYFRQLGMGLIIYFTVINFSDSYLLGHFTSFQFIFFSAILSKNLE